MNKVKKGLRNRRITGYVYHVDPGLAIATNCRENIPLRNLFAPGFGVCNFNRGTGNAAPECRFTRLLGQFSSSARRGKSLRHGAYSENYRRSHESEIFSQAGLESSDFISYFRAVISAPVKDASFFVAGA